MRERKITKKHKLYVWWFFLRRYFTERDGFEGMTYLKEIIVLVLHLFVEGLSLSKITKSKNFYLKFFTEPKKKDFLKEE